nr:ammonium transporter Rh type B [Pelodiscus sinensis]|eukprot:XP_025035925.1 ammonium transporter Rh type B [Pelodiscus sinensis]
MSSHATRLRLKLPAICCLLQLVTIILFAVFIRYDQETSARLWHEELTRHNKSNRDNEFYFRYPSFQDVHTMIFIGFGFLMTFLKRYGFGSVAFNFLIAAFAIESMINADFCSGAVLISFGAVLGKTSPVQLLLMALFEVTLFGINEYILLSLIGAKDAGGSMTIHTFGAYFGLMVSRVLYRPQLDKSKQREGSVYHSDLFAMIGTIYLWLFWPSFNSAITAHGDDQLRTVMNTYFSLAASTLATFAISALVNEEGKLDMVHIQNAALAGGVVVGTSAEMMLTPFGAMIAGCLAGLVSTLGFRFLTPILDSRLKIQDTCGVHNLHGITKKPFLFRRKIGTKTHPGQRKLQEALHIPGSCLSCRMADVFPLIADGSRTATYQGACQFFALLITLGVAVVGGSLVGAGLKIRALGAPPDTQCFEDQLYWEVPENHHDGYLPAANPEDPERSASI